MSTPVLLVHGFASSYELEWRQPGWVELLRDAGRDVIGVDLLGHGTSEKPHEPAAYAHLEMHIVAQLPPEPVDAVGFSLGGMCVLRLASAHPERFRRIVIGGVGERSLQHNNPEETAKAIEAVATGQEFGEADTLGRAFQQFAKNPANDPLALAACLRRNDPPLTLAELARVTATTLFVVGDRDFVGSSEPLAAAMPAARVKVLKGVDHFGTPKHFGFIDAVLGFIDA